MDDSISRQAAIDALKVAYWDNDIQSAKDDPCIVDAMTDWAIRQVKALPSAQRWIPVSERLPSKNEYGKVLVTFIPSGGTLWTKVIIAEYSDLMGISKPSFHIGEVGKISFANITNQVTAWMPLPEPYRKADMRGKRCE